MDIIKNNTKGDANPLYVYKRDQKRGKGEKKNPFFLKQNLLNCKNKIGGTTLVYKKLTRETPKVK